MISGWNQTDPRLTFKEREYACAVLDGIYLLPDEYTPEMVNELVVSLIAQTILDPDCTIRSWARFLGALPSQETAVRYPLQFSRIAGASYQCEDDEKEILKGSLSNIGGFHFVVGDGKPFTGVSNVTWDSMDRPDIMSKYWTFVEKVVVKVGEKRTPTLTATGSSGTIQSVRGGSPGEFHFWEEDSGLVVQRGLPALPLAAA